MKFNKIQRKCNFKVHLPSLFQRKLFHAKIVSERIVRKGNTMGNLFLDALKNQASRPPVWFMRQAGRYLPEYRKLRESFSFLEMCKNPEAAAEASMQPIERLNMDAVICFSDILTVLQAIGLSLDFNPGPVLENPIKDIEQFRALDFKNPISRLSPIMDTLSILKKQLSEQYPDKALLGFTGLPFTLAAYAVEGKTSKNFDLIKSWMYREPEQVMEIFDTLSDIIIDYCIAQHKSGADAVQLFDSWAGTFSIEDYKTYILPCTKKIIQSLKSRNIPVILFIHGGAHLLPAMIETCPDCISLDWRVNLKTACELIPEDIAIQGNMDPSFLFAPPELVYKKATDIMQTVRNSGRKNHILNLGHGVHPTTPIEGAKAFVDAALNFCQSV
jgi:uroporphyrinogen decarboxylase